MFNLLNFFMFYFSLINEVLHTKNIIAQKLFNEFSGKAQKHSFVKAQLFKKS